MRGIEQAIRTAAPIRLFVLTVFFTSSMKGVIGVPDL
jgi:hypothetical protein